MMFGVGKIPHNKHNEKVILSLIFERNQMENFVASGQAHFVYDFSFGIKLNKMESLMSYDGRCYRVYVFFLKMGKHKIIFVPRRIFRSKDFLFFPVLLSIVDFSALLFCRSQPLSSFFVSVFFGNARRAHTHTFNIEPKSRTQVHFGQPLLWASAQIQIHLFSNEIQFFERKMNDEQKKVREKERRVTSREKVENVEIYYFFFFRSAHARNRTASIFVHVCLSTPSNSKIAFRKIDTDVQNVFRRLFSYVLFHSLCVSAVVSVEYLDTDVHQ